MLADQGVLDQTPSSFVATRPTTRFASCSNFFTTTRISLADAANTSKCCDGWGLLLIYDDGICSIRLRTGCGCGTFKELV